MAESEFNDTNGPSKQGFLNRIPVLLAYSIIFFCTILSILLLSFSCYSENNLNSFIYNSRLHERQQALRKKVLDSLSGAIEAPYRPAGNQRQAAHPAATGEANSKTAGKEQTSYY